MEWFLIRVAVIVVVMTPIWVCMFEDIYLVMLAYQFLSEGLGSAIVIFGPRSCCMYVVLAVTVDFFSVIFCFQL